MPILLVSSGAADAVASAYDRAFPLEACGFLLGAVRKRELIVTEVVVATGRAYRGAFEIADYELRRVGVYAEDRGLRITALFHSHPSGDRRLSQSDLAALRYSAWPWVIVTRLNEPPTVALTCYTPRDATRIVVRVETRS